MDSKAVNKLIRSEVWPLLRDQGFSHFEARTALRFGDSLIDVVNFQSFNSYLAEGIGCTTFSFAVNLGVYVVGGDREDLFKKDPTGVLLPREYECGFRGTLKKRTSVDGFGREDIFYIDADGHTAGPVFREVRQLLTEEAKRWFEAHNSIDALITRMETEIDSRTDLPSEAGLGVFANPGSYTWNNLCATLRLSKHTKTPTSQTAHAAFREIEHLIGSLMDFTFDTVPLRETQAFRIRELWQRLGSFAPAPATCSPLRPMRTTLMGSTWAVASRKWAPGPKTDREFQAPSVRQQLWPLLKSHGFAEFTQRLAHRVSTESVEVVEVAQIEPAERKTFGETGLFRVGVGIFWPMLKEDGLFRTNRENDPRPNVAECHLSDWLMPEPGGSTIAPSVFETLEQARASLEADGLSWFNSFRSAESALSILQQDDWKIFWCLPMMRGSGANSSTRRLIFLAYLASRLHRVEEARVYLHQAERAIGLYPEHLRKRFREWFDAVRDRLKLNPVADDQLIG